jgi:3-oxoacyl-[acyl-carrier protein] reductase
VLVSNAGISKAATIKDHTVEDFDNLFATSVRGPFFLVQQLLPVLHEVSNIIVISSIGAHAVVGKPGLDNPSILAYASTKGALETLVKNWAAILAARHPGKCSGARGNRHRHVESHKDRGRS